MEPDPTQLTREILNVSQNLRNVRPKLNYLTPENIEKIKDQLNIESVSRILAPVLATESIDFDIEFTLNKYKSSEVTVDSLKKRHTVLSECMTSFMESHVLEKVQYFMLLHFLNEAEKMQSE